MENEGDDMMSAVRGRRRDRVVTSRRPQGIFAGKGRQASAREVLQVPSALEQNHGSINTTNNNNNHNDPLSYTSGNVSRHG